CALGIEKWEGTRVGPRDSHRLAATELDPNAARQIEGPASRRSHVGRRVDVGDPDCPGFWTRRCPAMRILAVPARTRRLVRRCRIDVELPMPGTFDRELDRFEAF